MTDFEKELRRNATYWSEDGEGTAGYLLSEEQFKAITRAHEAAVAEIIGEDEAEPIKSAFADIESAVAAHRRWNNRKYLRREQRSRAKLPEEGSK